MTYENTALDQRPGESPDAGMNWLLLLIPIFAVGLAVMTSRYDLERFTGLQVILEYPAPWMVAIVAGVYILRSVWTRNRLYIILAGLAAIFTMREFHFEWMDKGVYFLLAALGMWALLWRKSLVYPLAEKQHTSWLVATCFAYVLSQLIARRAFRCVPGEHEIHRSLEECAETAAHMMFIATSLVGSWRKYHTSGTVQPHMSKVETDETSAAVD